MINSLLKIILLCVVSLSICFSLTECSKDKQNNPTESVEQEEPLDDEYEE